MNRGALSSALRVVPRSIVAIVCAACCMHALLGAVQEPSAAEGQVPVVPPDGQAVPIVREIEVLGLAVHEPARIASMLGYTVGSPLPGPVRQAAGVDDVWQDYGILLMANAVELQPVDGGMRVVLTVIEPGVDLDPKFVGNATYGESRLREWALLDDRVELYIHEAPNVVERLERAYRRQGFHFAEVEAVIGGEGTRRDQVIFEIREGPKVRITKVHVRGNESLPDTGFWLWAGGLRSLAKLGTKGRGVFAWLGRKYDEEVLLADLVSMRNVYRDLGYLDARVELERMEFTPDRRRAEVFILVDEGPQYTVSSVQVVGVEVQRDQDGEPIYAEVPLILPEDELKELMRLRAGEPLEQARVNEDERSLRSRYGKEGHLENDFFDVPIDRPPAERENPGGWRFHPPELTYDVEKKTVAVRYRVQQGRPLVVRQVVIEGNTSTRDRVLRREVTQMPGERADFDAILRAARRLRGLGFFSDPRDPRHPEPEVSFVPVEGSPDEVDVVYRVREGQTIDANLSGGVASDQGLVGLISLSIRNFDAQNLPSEPWRVFSEVYRKEAFIGDGERFSVDLAPGSEVSYWRVLYTHPDLFGTHFDRISSTVEFLNREREYSSHDEERTRGRVTFGRNFGVGDLRASFGFQWQEVVNRNLNFEEDLPQTLIRSEGGTTYVGFTGSISYDDLDNRQAPNDGWSINWSNTLYFEDLGGDDDLWATELTWDWFKHFDEDEFTAAPGIHVGLSGGVATEFGPGPNFVNYSERYFLGGSQRMRGFAFRGVGPYDGDYAEGGESYVYNTLEYHFPLYATPQPGTARRTEILRAGFFVDSAIIDPEAWELDGKELRMSAGFQVGLTAPFPVTFSFGWPLISDEADETQVFSFRLAFGR